MREAKIDRSQGLSALIDSFQQRGRYWFTREEVSASLSQSPAAIRSAARRLAAKGRIVSPYRGFAVIVPAEYRTAGAPPASWFIDSLMRYAGQPDYYIGLLSAAALHGAGQQQPQELQVMVARPMRAAQAGRARIRYIVKLGLEQTPVVRLKTETGTMRVSTAEATAIDLVRYAARVGQIEAVAPVLAALAERLDGKRLVAAARHERELAPLQRLGHLLERVGASSVAQPLHGWLSKREARVVPLRPDLPRAGARSDARWSLAINTSIELDA